MKRSIVLFSIAFSLIGMNSCKNGDKGSKMKDVPEQQPIVVAGMQQDTVEFESGDGLMMCAIVYEIDTTSPVIVLCHQADMSNYEYAEVAPKLNQIGFNCIALDQRAGGTMDKHENLTYNRAKEKNLPTNYLDAEQDIIAGINYAYNKWNKPVILWGSSYSAGLCLKIGNTNDQVRAIIGFSPGEYYEGKLSVKESVKGLSKPTFVTSTEKEAAPIEKMLADVPEGVVTQYFPDMKGTHGSKALWSADPANTYYWEAVSGWLVEHK